MSRAAKGAKRRYVREPVQVYLDERDRALLEALVERSALSRADIIRLGLRRLSVEMLREKKPGASVEGLTGALDAAADIPTDLAARHDEYLYFRQSGRRRRTRGRR